MQKKTHGPVRLTDSAKGAKARPIGLNEITLSTDGQLGAWQKQNAQDTVPHLIDNLISTGALANLQNLNTPAFDFKGMWFSDSDIHKSLEALAWSLHVSDDPKQIEFLKTATAAIEHAQEEDGYVYTWYQGVHPDKKWQEFSMGHEMYVAGHLIQAAVAESRVRGDAPLMTIARKFADLLVKKFGGNNKVEMCGHPEIETALIELYRETGAQEYFDLAEKMIMARGHGTIRRGQEALFHFGDSYLQDHKPVLEADTVVGHSVRQLYLNAGVMDIYLEKGDDRFLKIQEKQWEDMVYTKMYITGGLGSRHKDEAFGDSYELPNDRAYAETCASIANFMWDWRLLLATERGRYADNMERALYNIIAGSISSDGCKFFYSNPLQYRKGHFTAFDTDASERLGWYKCSCCPPNIGRIAATFNHYLTTTSGDVFSVHLYTDSVIQTETESGNSVDLTIKTKYPADGIINVTVNKESKFALKLRIPEWTKGNFKLIVAGQSADVKTDANGYVVIDRDWHAGDSVRLELEMKAHFLKPHPLIDASRGCVAIQRGPVVFAIEQADATNPQDDVEEFLVDSRSEITETTVEIPGYGKVPALSIQGAFSPLETPMKFPYEETISRKATSNSKITAIPYSLWGNRVKGAMRVWIPEKTN